MDSKEEKEIELKMDTNPKRYVPPVWLDRTVLGAGLTSLFADMAYETASAFLPGFLTILGYPHLLGLIEGSADLASNFIKIGIGWYSDRIGKRKAIVSLGYFLTGTAFIFYALAISWPFVLLGKLVAWAGKGLRGPLRDAILADAVDPLHRGKAFGFHRAGDTVGAILGPLLGGLAFAYYEPFLKSLGLLDFLYAPADSTESLGYRFVFWLTLIPGILSVLCFTLLIKETHFTPLKSKRFSTSIRTLPKSFRRYLVSIGFYGLGDCSLPVILLAAVKLLSSENLLERPWLIAILLAWRNLWHALAAFPIGYWSDHRGRRPLLQLGYGIQMASMACWGIAFYTDLQSYPLLLLLLAAHGIAGAFQDTLESAMTADLVTDSAQRGSAYGLMSCLNGLGDFISSTLIAFVLFYSPVFAFLWASSCMGIAAFSLKWVDSSHEKTN